MNGKVTCAVVSLTEDINGSVEVMVLGTFATSVVPAAVGVARFANDVGTIVVVEPINVDAIFETLVEIGDSTELAVPAVVVCLAVDVVCEFETVSMEVGAPVVTGIKVDDMGIVVVIGFIEVVKEFVVVGSTLLVVSIIVDV